VREKQKNFVFRSEFVGKVENLSKFLTVGSAICVRKSRHAKTHVGHYRPYRKVCNE
jgi:hypothetical protein